MRCEQCGCTLFSCQCPPPKDESIYRMVRPQTNAMLDDKRIRVHAGDYVIQIETLDGWVNYDGPYSSTERATAESRLKQLQATEVPQIFDDATA